MSEWLGPKEERKEKVESFTQLRVSQLLYNQQATSNKQQTTAKREREERT